MWCKCDGFKFWHQVECAWSCVIKNTTKITWKICVSVCVCLSLFVHVQWFGNIVTMDWWDDLWLNEGFASFFEYIGVEKAEPDWGMVSFHHDHSSVCLNRFISSVTFMDKLIVWDAKMNHWYFVSRAICGNIWLITVLQGWYLKINKVKLYNRIVISVSVYIRTFWVINYFLNRLTFKQEYTAIHF